MTNLIYEAIRQNIVSRRCITTFTCSIYRKHSLPYIQVTLLVLNNKEREKICTVDSSSVKVDMEVRFVKAEDQMKRSVCTEEERLCFWQPLNYQMTECTTDFFNLCIYRRRLTECWMCFCIAAFQSLFPVKEDVWSWWNQQIFYCNCWLSRFMRD
jgi:hypothetical protein